MFPQEFVAKWRGNTSNEKQVYQQHFLDLCALVGHPTPAALDPENKFFTFEAGAAKLGGGNGWADVWFRGHFAIEYKGPGKSLSTAYEQLLQYRESLENPPLLVTGNTQELHIHTNFTNSTKQVVTVTLDDLLTPAGVQHIRNMFYNVEAFRPEKTAAQVTEEAAARFGALAEYLRKWGYQPDEIAHYLIRVLFCLFAEDIGLLPHDLFTRLIDHGRRKPKHFTAQVADLFKAMADGEHFGEHNLLYFDGGLFDEAPVLDLDSDALASLHRIAMLDWSSIEPAIFGTLFTRSLDPGSRAKLGAQYTSKEDIILIVEPVLMAPLRREWADVQEKARLLAQKRDSATSKRAQTQAHDALNKLILAFAEKLATVRVLDPACGSGNFLYVALRLLLDLWKAVAIFAAEMGLPMLSPLPGLAPSPEQLYGIEINDYAHELAQATVWIGYLQWLHDNGYGVPVEPILKPLDNIKQMDAILAFDEDGNPVEPEWPEVEIIVGNPPFLGDKKMRTELGGDYVELLRGVYRGRIPGQSDLVCYWFEKTRAGIESGKIDRAGLLATNSIRTGANRQVLERIKSSGDIFMAWGDRPWILDGAAVRVSMIGFDNGSEWDRVLDGVKVRTITSALAGDMDFSNTSVLEENSGIGFVGITKKGPFDIDAVLAERMLAAPPNPNSRSNSDVVRQWVNASDLVQVRRGKWIVDFGVNMTEQDAAQYEMPFEYVRGHVKPFRDNVRNFNERTKWWLHGRPAPAFRVAISGLGRYIATPTVAKHRVFVWLSEHILPTHGISVFARNDDYFLGVLQSRSHELWSLRQGNWMGVGNDPAYTPSTCFETFPFPWPPGKEPQNDQRVQAIAAAAKELVEQRDAWLNPPGLSESELKKRTLTNLYNERPAWLDKLHRWLDAAVFDAYGWPHDLTDDQILERLLALNLERAGK